jgi:hypothetical protein
MALKEKYSRNYISLLCCKAVNSVSVRIEGRHYSIFNDEFMLIIKKIFPNLPIATKETFNI